MATAYEELGITQTATRAELEAAYRAKRAAYDADGVADLGHEFVELARQRRADITAAYHHLRTAIAAPPSLEPAAERRRDRETILALLVLLALAMSVPLLRGIAAPERTAIAQGADTAALTAKPAPAFTLEAVDGQQISLSDLKGKVVLLNLWATWCPPCVRETPRLVRVYETYKQQGFVVLGINTTYQDDRAKVAQFVRDKQISYPVLLDLTDQFGEKYGARLLPTSYLIDQSGRIVSTKVGEVDEAQLGEQIQALVQAGATTP